MSWLLADPDRVPGQDLDPEAVERSAAEARTFTERIGDQGGAVREAWRGLGDSYQDPSTPDLLTKMDPVAMRTSAMAAGLGKVAAALGALAGEQRSIKHERATLVTAILDFRSRVTREVSGLGGTIADIGLSVSLPDRLDRENTALIGRSRTLDARIQEAEQDCARAIRDASGVTGGGNPLTDLWNATTAGVGNTVNRVSDEVLEFWNGTTQATTTAWDNTAQTVTAAWGATTNWFNDRIDDVATGIGHGQRWVGDRAADLGDWYTDTTTDVSDWVEDVTDLNNWPSSSEWLAGEIMETGQQLTDLPFPGWTSRVFDDGVAHADEPVPWDFSRDPDKNELPYNLAGLTGGVDAAYEDARRWEGREQSTKGLVRVTTMETPEGPRVVVSVPGTMEWGPVAGDNPMDVTSDLATMNGSGQSTVSDAVRLAMGKANIPDDAEVMMVGHSLGGITVGHLLEDPEFAREYHVTHAMTFGSPIESFRIDPDLHVTQFGHTYDVVHRLDLGDDRLGFGAPEVDRGPNQSKIILDSPEAFWKGKMSHENYTASMRANADDSRLVAYEQELREAGYLLPPPPTQPGPWKPGEAPMDTPGFGSSVPQVSVEYVPVERKFDR